MAAFRAFSCRWSTSTPCSRKPRNSLKPGWSTSERSLRAMKSPLLTPMAVIGAGSWGTALAIQCARAGHPTRLWGRDAGAIREMRLARRNARYLPDAEFPPSLEPVADLAEALAGVRD